MKTTKKILCALLSVMLVLTAAFALFACDDDAPTCTSHVDNNNDLFCDNCNATVPCTNHYDNNGDMRCDRCMRPMPCTNHVDQNNDASCDKCGAYVAPSCTSHVDSNGDLKCDTCGADVACTEHVDDDGDDECDKCGTEMEEEAKSLLLIEGGLVNFQFVLAKSASTDVRSTIELDIITELKREHDIEIPLVLEGYSNDIEQDMEILIGDVQNRGDEYLYDRYSLGEKGYIIKIVGDKVLINAGSDEALCDALIEFAEEVIGLGGDEEIFDVLMTNDDEIEEIQDNYKVTSLAVNGNDMKGYTIATDTINAYYKTAATLVQQTLYSRTGYYFEIVHINSVSENSIVIKHIDKIFGEDSYAIKAVGNQLVIECAFDNMLEKATNAFLLQTITEGSGDIDFTGNVYNQDISVVYYEDFGAMGDGKTDDYAAIFKTHQVANECGQTVKATPGARYYICNNIFIAEGEKKLATHSAIIQTNVDWGNAEFIIDDTTIGYNKSDAGYGMNSSIFKVQPDENLKMIKISDPTILQRLVSEGINPTTTKIVINSEEILNWDGPIMIIPYNTSHRVYRRRGYSAFAGGAMHEVILLDAEGNVSDETPIMFDYTSLNYVEVYRLDPSTAITVEGGVFTTIASTYNCIDPDGNGAASNYTSRNINVQRSFTTVRNVKHYVTGEATPGQQVDSNGKVILVTPCYNGFFSASSANHVTFENCVLSGRRCYQRPVGGTGGTYDISGNEVNFIVFKDCVQHNFWVVYDEQADIIRPAQENTKGALPSMASISVNGKSLKMHWGIGGTNYCKNMQYLGSTLSRFDAHSGLYNGKVIDSTVNYLAITGNGEFIVENVRYFAEGTGYGSNSLFHLRSDYGSTWDGEITLKNVDAYAYFSANVYLFYHSYQNWYFGYMAGFPSISIDNLNYYDINSRLPVAAGTKIYLADSTVSASSKMHLSESHKQTIVSIEDKDKDGFIDEPAIDLDRDGIIDPALDLDGNGVAGNTGVNYNDLLAEYKAQGKDTESGITISSYINTNIIKPPKYIKILNNDGVDGSGGYTYVVSNTAKNKNDPNARISDGGWYDDVETWGGFLGDTKFYYSETEYFTGSDHVGQTKTSSFLFVN